MLVQKFVQKNRQQQQQTQLASQSNVHTGSLMGGVLGLLNPKNKQNSNSIFKSAQAKE